jgi:predicted acylesterase/phospholipase RssA
MASGLSSRLDCSNPAKARLPNSHSTILRFYIFASLREVFTFDKLHAGSNIVGMPLEPRHDLFQRLFAVGVALFLSGCTTFQRHAPPEDEMTSASICGLHDIRAFSGIPSESFKKDYLKLLEGRKNIRQALSLLAISGGGSNGAFGAGLLKGWSKTGARPNFDIVTGISTGAIIAPFAFLGPAYDENLEEFYTRYSTHDLFEFHIPFRNSFASTEPLKRQLAAHFDKTMLAKIAEEYARGRRLYVGTTDLDEQRLVIWDMGKIATAGSDDALRLFRQVILASSSIPIVSPPVYFDVDIHGNSYNEMHVDGGVVKQVFFPYDVLSGLDDALKARHINIDRFVYSIYVIRNGYIEPIHQEVADNLSMIGSRTIDTMINNQGIGDLYQIYSFSKLGNGSFHLAYIPNSYQPKAKEIFDPAEMRRLFDMGYHAAEYGYPWASHPPGIEE